MTGVRGSTGRPVGVLGRAGRIARFTGWYLLYFLRANYQVAREIVTPGDQLAPALVEVPLRSRTRVEVASYMSLVTLTPGTMAIGLPGGGARLLVHGMHADDPAAFVAELQELETRMLAAWRRAGRVADDDRTSRR